MSIESPPNDKSETIFKWADWTNGSAIWSADLPVSRFSLVKTRIATSMDQLTIGSGNDATSGVSVKNSTQYAGNAFRINGVTRERKTDVSIPEIVSSLVVIAAKICSRLVSLMVSLM